MRNLKVDPLFRGPRSRVWPRDKVYTYEEVLDICRKKFYILKIAEKRRLFILDGRERVVTRLVETTNQASSYTPPSPGKTFVVTI